MLNTGADKNLLISIEPSTTQFTSENVPFKMVFTNAGDKAISVLKPVMGRDMVIRVYGKTGEELARSGIPGEYSGGYGKNDNKEYVSLKPRVAWETEDYELFSATHPAFRVAPDQTVRVSVTYLLNGREYKAETAIDIPAHDL